MVWVIHTKVFIDPDFSLTISCKSDHVVSDSAWNNQLGNIVVASKSIVYNDKRLLFVQSWDGAQKKRNSFSQDESAFLGSTESKTSWWKVGSNDLNPIGGASSFMVKFNFIIEVSVGLDIEVVKVSLLSFLASHGFEESGFFDLFPVLWIVVELFCFWVMVSHFCDILLIFINKI